MGHISFVSGSVMAGIFVACIILFAVGFAVDNDSDITLADDSQYSSLDDALKSNLTSFQEDANDSSTIFYGTTLESGDEHAGSGGQFKVGVFSALTLVITSIGASFNVIFGGDTNFDFIILSLGGLLSFVATMWAYKAWIGRNPD